MAEGRFQKKGGRRKVPEYRGKVGSTQKGWKECSKKGVKGIKKG